MQFDLMISGKRSHVTWSGENGEDAARRYVDCHRDAAVTAWRPARRPMVTVLDRGRIDG